MSLTLHVATARWRAHLESLAAALGSALVPVVKGNGYGFGREVLAEQATALDLPALAVGTYEELPSVRDGFAGDLVVLTPWRPFHPTGVPGPADPRVVHTVSRLADLTALAGTGVRVLVEVATSMRRHGIAPLDTDRAAALVAGGGLQMAGWSVHLPLAGDALAEAARLARGLDGPLWVSHVRPHQLTEIGPDVRLRMGTGLWLGARDALAVRAVVLDVHRLDRGTTYGYRQRRARRAGTLLVVGGGTAHGIAMEAPTPAVSLRQRGVSLARGGLAATGKALSPYRVAGAQRWFAEPPHMQCSMVWLPADVPAPRVGDEIDVDVRFTTTTVDRISWD